jgi:hypothetical protein
MMKYKFLFKPLFFIFNLIFATWLVLKIEKIKPSDFGEHKTLFDPAPTPRIVTPKDKVYLKKLAYEYKYGIIDSLKLDQKLQQYLEVPKEDSKVLSVK